MPPLAEGRLKLNDWPTIAERDVPDEANEGPVSAATLIWREYVSVSPSASATVHVIAYSPAALGCPLTDDDVTVKPAHVPLTE